MRIIPTIAPQSVIEGAPKVRPALSLAAHGVEVMMMRSIQSGYVQQRDVLKEKSNTGIHETTGTKRVW
jgi:hypothetical protein